MTQMVTIEEYRKALRSLHAEQQIITGGINSRLRNKTVLLNAGRFKNRYAIILDYYFDAGNEYLHVLVTPNNKTEVIELDDCEMI